MSLQLKQEISIVEIVHLAKYKQMLANDLEKTDPDTAANLRYQAEEYHKLSHEMIRSAAKNSLDISLSKMIGTTGSYLSLSYDLLKKDAKQLSLKLPDPNDFDDTKALKELAKSTTQQEKKEMKEQLDKSITHENLKEKAAETGRNVTDVQIQLLKRNKEADEEEPEFISALRTTLCQLITEGKRNEAVRFTKNLVIRPTIENPEQEAHSFVNSMKEQFELNEPKKNPRKIGHNTNIPNKKWIYAEYELLGENGKHYKTKDFLKRVNSIDMIKSTGQVACHAINVKKMRLASKAEVAELEKKLPKY